MTKLANRSIFRKIIKFIDGKIGRTLRKTKDCYKYSKCYTGRDHILSMLFIQFSNCNGLRDIHYKYRNSRKLSKEFNLPSYSQLSRLNKNKDTSIFSDLFSDLLAKAEKEIKELNNNTLEHYKLLLIKLVNSTYTSLITKQLRNYNETIKLLLSEELNRLNNSKAEKAASLKMITTANIGNQLKEILKNSLTEEEKMVVENLFNSKVISEEVEELNKALEETHKAKNFIGIYQASLLISM